MQLKGYTQFGMLTAMLILALQLFLVKFSLASSGLVALQYVLLLMGIFVSVYLYNKNNRLIVVDLFMIGFRTLSSAVAILVIGQLIFFWLLPKPKGLEFTAVLIRVILPLVFSGMISSFVCAIIVNKLLTKE